MQCPAMPIILLAVVLMFLISLQNWALEYDTAESHKSRSFSSVAVNKVELEIPLNDFVQTVFLLTVYNITFYQSFLEMFYMPFNL